MEKWRPGEIFRAHHLIILAGLQMSPIAEAAAVEFWTRMHPAELLPLRFSRWLQNARLRCWLI
jgi:hypothetical protein